MKKLLLAVLAVLSMNTYAQDLDVVGGYFPYWRSTQNIKFENYNYLYYAFVYATPNGGVEFINNSEPNFQTFLSATNGLDSKRIISVGGTNIEVMANDPAARVKFADSLRLFCRKHDLDGIDMDWEAINNTTDRDNFTSLVKEIRNNIDSTDLEFVITVGFGNYWLQWYENDALDQADFLQIMIYDQTGTWAGSPYGSHASMDHFKAAETYWVGRGYPRSKLAMGLPYYGYKFQDATGGLAEAVTYADIMQQFPNALPSDNLLIDGTGHYFFNGADLIQEKTQYAIDNGFKGVFVWELAQDDYNHPLSLDRALTTTGTLTVIEGDYNKEQFVISPNPANDYFNVKSIEGVESIILLDVNGRMLKNITPNINIDISELAKGIYFVNYSNKKNQLIGTEKLVIK
tara:strand:- start:249 stop:1454 length:1206 start_codon:yes stop_codon:yes gene_type:complete